MIPNDLLDKITNKNIILSVSFELTWRCNLHCLYCYQYPPCDGELTTSEVKDILDQLAQAGAFYLSFTGGEPLIREDFLEIAEYARKKTFSIRLQTNGTLITQPIAEQISRLNFSCVHISLLGATASVHDRITGVKGSFQRVVKAAELLKEKGIDVVLMTTLMKPNFTQYRLFKELADSLGVKTVVSPIIYPASNGDKKPLEFRLTDQEVKEAYSYYFRTNPRVRKELSLKRSALLCGFGRITCCINPKGEVYPCGALPLIVGNLRKMPLQKIWQTSKILEEIRSIKITDLEECSECQLSSSCFRCSAMAYLERGDIKSVPNECCRLTKVLKEVIS